jgi:hypothetical protein
MTSQNIEPSSRDTLYSYVLVKMIRDRIIKRKAYYRRRYVEEEIQICKATNITMKHAMNVFYILRSVVLIGVTRVVRNIEAYVFVQ